MHIMPKQSCASLIRFFTTRGRRQPPFDANISPWVRFPTLQFHFDYGVQVRRCVCVCVHVCVCVTCDHVCSVIILILVLNLLGVWFFVLYVMCFMLCALCVVYISSKPSLCNSKLWRSPSTLTHVLFINRVSSFAFALFGCLECERHVVVLMSYVEWNADVSYGSADADGLLWVLILMGGCAKCMSLSVLHGLLVLFHDGCMDAWMHGLEGPFCKIAYLHQNGWSQQTFSRLAARTDKIGSSININN